MNQAVDASSQTNEHTEVGDRFDGAFDAVATLGVLREILPWVGFALFHAQRNATLVFVDFQNHDFNFVTQGHEFGRCNVLVGPIHFGDMHQTFDSWLEFHKCAVVGDVGDLAEQARVLWVATVDAHPGIVAHLLETQGDTVFLGVELENFGCDFLTCSHHFAWMTDTTPCHVGDVQQAVNAAEVNECTVFSDVFDHAVNNCAFFQSFHHFGAFCTHGHFNHRAVAQHHVVAFAIKLDHFELQSFVLVRRQIFDRACLDQRTWQESTDTIDQHGQAAFDFATGGAGDEFAGFQRLFQAHP